MYFSLADALTLRDIARCVTRLQAVALCLPPANRQEASGLKTAFEFVAIQSFHSEFSGYTHTAVTVRCFPTSTLFIGFGGGLGLLSWIGSVIQRRQRNFTQLGSLRADQVSQPVRWRQRVLSLT